MHPHLSAALARLDEARRELRAAVDVIPAPARAQKPAPDRWSVTDVLEHVSLVEHNFLSAIVEKVTAARTAGLGDEVAQPEGLPEQAGVLVRDRSNRRNAPEVVHPRGGIDADAAFSRIADGHARLRKALASADGLALSTVTHDHRFFGTLNVYQWIDLVAGHEARHTAQIREIAGQISAA